MTIFATQPNVISSLNSNTEPLDNGETFTGAWENVELYGDVIVAVATDQAGYYQIQFSPDGVNADSTLTRYHKASEIHVPHRFTITRKFCRVVFTNNSGSNQTYMRLQTSFGNRHPLNAPLDGIIAQDFDATCVRPTGYIEECIIGLRQGTSTFSKHGYNDTIDSAAPETVWSIGGRAPVQKTARTLSVVSSDAADDDGSTGALTVTIIGIDANREYQTETITMNGVTPVVTSGTWLGVNRAIVASAGTGLQNAGNITGTFSTDATSAFQIPAGDGTTQQCIFFTEANQKAILHDIMVNIRKLAGGTAPRTTTRVMLFNFVTNSYREIWRINMDAAVENSFQMSDDVPFLIPEQCMVEMVVTTNTDNTAGVGRMHFLTFKDADTA